MRKNVRTINVRLRPSSDNVGIYWSRFRKRGLTLLCPSSHLFLISCRLWGIVHLKFCICEYASLVAKVNVKCSSRLVVFSVVGLHNTNECMCQDEYGTGNHHNQVSGMYCVWTWTHSGVCQHVQECNPLLVLFLCLPDIWRNSERSSAHSLCSTNAHNTGLFPVSTGTSWISAVAGPCAGETGPSTTAQMSTVPNMMRGRAPVPMEMSEWLKMYHSYHTPHTDRYKLYIYFFKDLDRGSVFALSCTTTISGRLIKPTATCLLIIDSFPFFSAYFFCESKLLGKVECRLQIVPSR